MPIFLRVLVAAGALGTGAGALADCRITAQFPDSSLDGWKQREFEGRTDYRLEEQDGLNVLVATAEGSASVLYRERKVDVTMRPILDWTWSVDGVYENIEERTRDGDDFPARLYVVFKTGFLPWQTLALNYVWGSAVAAGSDWPSPYTEKAHMIAVRSGSDRAGEWVCESRDVVADFQRVFGVDVDTIEGYAVMVDGDNGKRRGRARFGDIAFRPR